MSPGELSAKATLPNGNSSTSFVWFNITNDTLDCPKYDVIPIDPCENSTINVKEQYLESHLVIGKDISPFAVEDLLEMFIIIKDPACQIEIVF